MIGYLSVFFYLLSLLAGALSIGITVAFFYIHRLNAVRWYALILASFLSIVLMLTVQLIFRLAGTGLPLFFRVIVKVLSVAGPCLLMLAFPRFIFVVFSIETPRGGRTALLIFVGAIAALGTLNQWLGIDAISEYVLTPALFLTVTASMALALIHWRRIAVRSVRRALSVFLAVTALFGPVIGLELYRQDIPVLRDIDVFELFTTPLYFFVLTCLSIAFSISYFRRPAYLRANSLTPDFMQEYGLTRREAEVVERLVAGRSYKEMADDLGISAKTVDNHLQSVYQKTGVQGRLQLVNLIRSNEAAPVPRRGALKLVSSAN